MKRILILTAGFGEGHNAAARNLHEALEHLAPDEVQVETLDLFESCYGRFNDLVRKAYLETINRAPQVWGRIYRVIDASEFLQDSLTSLGRMRTRLSEILAQSEPDAVISTYPVYNYVLDQIVREGRWRHFCQITVVTDSITVNSIWYRGGSHYFLVPNDATAGVFAAAGIESERIRTFGFPVPIKFAELGHDLRVGIPGGRPRVLYMINSGKKKAPGLARKLSRLSGIDLTITVGRDPLLREAIERAVSGATTEVEIVGWTSRMPELMASSHLLIGKAGGATVQEAIAAKCPMLITQVVPGQEEGNARLLLENHCAEVVPDATQVVAAVERLFSDDAVEWRVWHENIRKLSKPDASLRIAQFVLDQAVPENPASPSIMPFRTPREPRGTAGGAAPTKRMLLCDIHTHTTFSDGKLTVPELVDFYGQRDFDVLCVTDHICDHAKLMGKLTNLSGLVLTPDEVEEYFEVLAKERRRALHKYGMILMTGLEFNKDALTKKNSAHLLGVDLKAPIDPSLSIVDIIAQIHLQGGLAIASHPHEFHSVWGKDTLHFWENIETYAPLLDAWEVANRDDLFSPIGLKRLPFVANSDFHKPKHIHSWKTMLYCEKDPEAVKECIRLNRDVSITLYRDYKIGQSRPLEVRAARHEMEADAARYGGLPAGVAAM